MNSFGTSSKLCSIKAVTPLRMRIISSISDTWLFVLPESTGQLYRPHIGSTPWYKWCSRTSRLLMKCQTKLSINQLSAVQETNCKKVLPLWKHTRLREQPFVVSSFVLCGFPWSCNGYMIYDISTYATSVGLNYSLAFALKVCWKSPHCFWAKT